MEKIIEQLDWAIERAESQLKEILDKAADDLNSLDYELGWDNIQKYNAARHVALAVKRYVLKGYTADQIEAELMYMVQKGVRASSTSASSNHRERAIGDKAIDCLSDMSGFGIAQIRRAMEESAD